MSLILDFTYCLQKTQWVLSLKSDESGFEFKCDFWVAVFYQDVNRKK